MDGRETKCRYQPVLTLALHKGISENKAAHHTLKMKKTPGFLPAFLNSDKSHWYFAFVSTLLFLVYGGYFFNSGDQEEHLPQVYKMFDPSLYPADYFMVPNEMTFSVRFYYKWLVYGLSCLMGVANACFILTFICLLLSAWSVSRISMYFYDSKLSAFIAPVFLFILFNDTCIGDNSFQDNELIGSTLSVACCSLAFLYYFREKFVTMIVLLGLGALFQVLAALLVAVLLCAMLVLDKKLPILKSLKYFLLFILVASPMLGPVIVRQFLTDGPYDKNAYYIALYNIRNPNHYLPSFFPWLHYLKFFGLMMFSWLVILLFPVKNARFVYILTLLVISGMFIYYLLLEKAGFMAIGKSQWFKATIWLTMFYAILTGIAVTRVITRWMEEGKVLNTLSYLSLPLLLLSGFILFQSSAIAHPFFRNRYRIGNYPKSDLQLMHEWIADNTPKDAVFLVSPGNFSFLCDAKRSLLIAHKAVVHEPYFMIPWAEKFQRVYAFRYDTLRTQKPLEAAKEGFTRKRYIPLEGEKLDYRLDNLKECKFVDSLGREVHREGDYVLTEIPKH